MPSTPDINKAIEDITLRAGQSLESVAKLPLLQGVKKIFGLKWLMSLLGEVDTNAIKIQVDTLKQQYPHETPQQIVQRILQQKSWEAGKLGFVTNLLPPLAITLFGIELAAITKLQAEMVYQIAAAYNLDLNHPRRRGEALGIFALSLGGGTLKTGLSFLEIVPGIGALVGLSTNAFLIYSLGFTADQFYRNRQDYINLNGLKM